MRAVIYGDPVPKPRMTKRDKWKARPCVMKYWAWCDLARIAMFHNPTKKVTLAQPTVMSVSVYVDSGTTKHRTGPHTLKPDADNVLKAALDALFTNDQMVYDQRIRKFWCDGGPPRVEVEYW